MADMAIVTLDGDVHAYVLKHLMGQRYGVDVAIVAADRLPAAGGLSWQPDGRACVPDDEGKEVDVGTLALVWWRRSGRDPAVPDAVISPAMRRLVSQDCRASLRGTFLTHFDGSWISEPHTTERAQNKLLQLRVASRLGLAVPDTLVSSDPDTVRQFVRGHGGRVVAKALTSILGTALEAGRVELASLGDDAELRLSPAIYQAEV